MAGYWLNRALILSGVALMLIAILTVYSTHEGRQLFVEGEQLRKDRDELEIEWNRLRLEQSTWATHARVEQLAREKLNMHSPSAEEIQVIGR